MLNDNLFDEILMAPAYRNGAHHLLILSRFANDNSARYHTERLRTPKLSVRVELVISMTPLQGLEEYLDVDQFSLATNLCPIPSEMPTN